MLGRVGNSYLKMVDFHQPLPAEWASLNRLQVSEAVKPPYAKWPMRLCTIAFNFNNKKERIKKEIMQTQKH